MYNRYIPQSDGTYRRNRVAEARPPAGQPCPPGRPAPPRQEAPHPPEKNPPACPPPSCPPREEAPCAPGPQGRQEQPVHAGAMGFLRRLLPQGLDTGDLLIIVLLLLMAGDCAEEQNTALLTLGLYLFL